MSDKVENRLKLLKKLQGSKTVKFDFNQWTVVTAFTRSNEPAFSLSFPAEGVMFFEGMEEVYAKRLTDLIDEYLYQAANGEKVSYTRRKIAKLMEKYPWKPEEMD